LSSTNYPSILQKILGDAGMNCRDMDVFFSRFHSSPEKTLKI